METFKVTFYREEKEKETQESETVEFMAANEEAAIFLFKQAEPFAKIIKIEQL